MFDFQKDNFPRQIAGTVDDSLAFIAEWFDKMAAVNKPFRIIFYPVDNSIEIIDLKSRKLFLKRIQYPGLTQKIFFHTARFICRKHF